MRFRSGLVLAFVTLSNVANAEAIDSKNRLSTEAFANYVTGKTLTYSRVGKVFGAEEYLSGNRVKWSFNNGQCQDGEWYAEQDQICFIYESQTVPQCWSFYIGETGLIAQYENAPAENNLVETDQSTAPLFCLGPEVGA